MIYGDNFCPGGAVLPLNEWRCSSTARGILLFILSIVATLILSGCSKGTTEPENSASPLRVRLMTGQQYSNTIAHIFGADISSSVLAPLPPLTRTDGLLASGAAFIGVTSDQTQQIQQAAAFVAAKVVDEQHRDFLIPCMPASPTQADSACATRFLKDTGRLVYRHPLDETKVAELVGVADAAADQLEDFYAGLGVALEAMLISPEAIFIIGFSRRELASILSTERSRPSRVWSSPFSAARNNASSGGPFHRKKLNRDARE